MAHKKIERKKELDRRRKRRAERIKARIHEAQALSLIHISEPTRPY